jgi:hypothetical protein
MIGGFAPSQGRENWKHLLFMDNLNVAYEIFLNSKGVLISTLQTEKKKY